MEDVKLLHSQFDESKFYSSESKSLQNSFRSSKLEIHELNESKIVDENKVFEICVNEYSAQIEQLNILLRKALRDLEIRVEEVAGLEKSLSQLNELLSLEKNARSSERLAFDAYKNNLEFELAKCNAKTEERDSELKILRDKFEDLQIKFTNFENIISQEEIKKLNDRHSQNVYF